MPFNTRDMYSVAGRRDLDINRHIVRGLRAVSIGMSERGIIPFGRGSGIGAELNSK